MAYDPEDDEDAPETPEAPISRGTRIATRTDRLAPDSPEVAEYDVEVAQDDIGATPLGNASWRAQLAQKEANERAKQEQLARNPFLFSNAIRPATQRQVTQVQRELDQSASEELQEYRRQQVEARREAAQRRKEANFARTEEFRSKGMLYRLDANGVPQPIVEASSGRQLYQPTAWEAGTHPKDNRPVRVMVDKYGQRQYKDYPLAESTDPTEGRFYYDVGEGQSVPAMTYEEAAASKDIGLSRRGKLALQRKAKAERDEAIGAMETLADSVNLDFNTAVQQRDAIKSRIEALSLNNGDPKELEQLATQQADLDAQLNPQNGALALRKHMADRALATEKIRSRYESYRAQGERIAERLKQQGIDPATDPTYQENAKALASFEAGLKTAQSREQEIERLIQPVPQVPAAPAPVASPSTVAESGKSFARGATSEGLYAASQGIANLFAESPVRRALNAAEDWATEKIQGFPLTEQQKATRQKLRQRAEEQTGIATVDRFAKDYVKATNQLRDDIRRALPVDEKFAQSLTGQISQGLGQLAGTAPLAAFGSPGIAAASVGQIYDEAYQDAKQSGQDDATAHATAMKYLPAAGLDFLADRMVIGKLLKPLQGKMTVGQLLKDVLATAAAEGSTEGGQQLYLNTIAKNLQGYDPNRPIDKDVIDSAIVGAVVGGTASGVGKGGRMALQRGEPTEGGNVQTPAQPPVGPTEEQAKQDTKEDDSAASRIIYYASEGSSDPKRALSLDDLELEISLLESKLEKRGKLTLDDLERIRDPLGVGESAVLNELAGGDTAKTARRLSALRRAIDKKLGAKPAPTTPPAAATPAQNFPTADLTEQQQAQADLEKAMAETERIERGAPLSAKEAAEVFEPALKEKANVPPPFKSAEESASAFEEAYNKAQTEEHREALKEARIQQLIDELSGGNDSVRSEIIKRRKGLSTNDFLKVLDETASFRRNPERYPDILRTEINREIENSEKNKTQRAINEVREAEVSPAREAKRELARSENEQAQERYDLLRERRDAIDDLLTSAERLRQSPEGAARLREQLAAEAAQTPLQEAAPVPAGGALEAAPEPVAAPATVGEVAPINTPEAQPEVGATIPEQPARVSTDDEAAIEAAAAAQQVIQQSTQPAPATAQITEYSLKAPKPLAESLGSVKDILNYRQERIDNYRKVLKSEIGLSEPEIDRLVGLLRADRDTARFEKSLTPEKRQRLEAFFDGPLNQRGGPLDDWVESRENLNEITESTNREKLAADIVGALGNVGQAPEFEASDRFISPVLALNRLAEIGGSWKDVFAQVLRKVSRMGAGDDSAELARAYSKSIKEFADKYGIKLPLESTTEEPKAPSFQPGVAPVVSEMIQVGRQSASELRKRISGVKYGPIENGKETIIFNLDGKPMKGVLTGRNRNLVLSGDARDVAIATRVLLDEEVSPLTTEEPTNALQERSPAQILQREQNGPVEAGSERGRVESSQQREAPAREGEAPQAVREEVKPRDYDAQETASGTTYQYKLVKEGDMWTAKTRMVRPDGTVTEWDGPIGVGRGRDRARVAERFAERFPDAAKESEDTDIKSGYDRIQERKATEQAKQEQAAKEQRAQQEAINAYREAVANTPLPKGQNKEIKIAFRNKDGEETSGKVVPAVVYGDWAIYKNENQYDKQNKYLVAHVPSGLKARGTENLANAKKLVQSFILSGVDASKEGMKSDNASLRKLSQAIQGIYGEQVPEWFKESQKSEPAQTAAEPAPSSELVPPSQMKSPALRAELKAAGVETVSGGVPVDEAAPNQLMAAVGQLRSGKLEETSAKPATIEEKLKAAKRLPKRMARGEVLTAGPDVLFDSAHDAAIDVAILAIRAGRAVKEAVELAIRRFRAVNPKATEQDVARARASIEAAISGPPPPTPTKGVAEGTKPAPSTPPSGQTFTGPVQPGASEFRKRSKSALGEYEYVAASTDNAKRKYAQEFADWYEKNSTPEKAISDMRAIDQGSFRSVVASELLGRTMNDWEGASVADKPALMARAQSLMEDIKAGKTEAAQALQAEGLVNKKLTPFVPMLDWMDMLRSRYEEKIEPQIGGPETSRKVQKGITDAGTEAENDLKETLATPEGEKPKLKNEKIFSEWLNRYASTINMLRTAAKNKGLVWGDIFTGLPENQEARKAELYDRVKAEPKLNNLTDAQKQRLASNLDEAWTELRNQIFRKEFGRLVPLPKVKPENVSKVRSVVDDIIRQSNLGTLNNDTFMQALAEKYGLEKMDGPTAQKLGELAGRMQRATKESEKARTLIEMSETLAKAKGVPVGDAIMSTFYSNLLNNLVTMTYAMGGGNVLQSMWNLGTLAAARPKGAKAIPRGLKTGIPEGLREALSIIVTGHGGEDAAAKLVEARGEPLEMISKGGVYPEFEAKHPIAAKGIQSAATVLKMTSRMARAIDAMFYYPSKQAAMRFLTEQSLLADYPNPKERAERAAELLQVRPQDFAEAEAKAKAEGFEGLDMSLRIADLLNPKSAIGKMAKSSETSRFITAQRNAAQREAIGEALHEEGTRTGSKSTLSMEPEGWAGVAYQGLSSLTERLRPRGFPVLKIPFPFLRLPTNFYNSNLMATPFGAISAAIGSTPTGQMTKGKMRRRTFTETEKAQLYMQSFIGSALMVYIIARAMAADPDDDKAFDVTANGPSDLGLRRQLEGHGWKKKSIRIPGTNTRVDYMNSPVAMPLTLAGHFADAYRYGKQKEDLVLGQYLPFNTIWDKALLDAASRFPSVIFGLPALSGMQQLSELLDEENVDADKVTKFLGRSAKNFVVPRVVDEVDRIFDPIVKDGGLVQYDELGEPIRRRPLDRVAKTESTDPVRKFLLRERIKLPVAGKQTLIDGKQMTPEQYQKYLQISGTRIKARLKASIPLLESKLKIDRAYNKDNPTQKKRNTAQEYINDMVEEERNNAKDAVRSWTLAQPAAAR